MKYCRYCDNCYGNGDPVRSEKFCSAACKSKYSTMKKAICEHYQISADHACELIAALTPIDRELTYYVVYQINERAKRADASCDEIRLQDLLQPIQLKKNLRDSLDSLLN